MSSFANGISPAAACANLQEVLQNTCSINTRDKVGFSQAILDAQNANINPLSVGFAQDGSSKVIRVTYRPRTSDTSTDVRNICDTLPGATVRGFDITPAMLMSRDSVEQFSLEDIRILCEQPDSFKSSTFNNMFNDLWRKINLANLDYINGIQPYFAGTTHPSGAFDIDLLQGSGVGEQVSVRDYNKVRRGIENLSCGPKFAWIGQADELDVAVTKFKLGCCDINGLDLSMMNDAFAYYYDSQMDGALGTNNTIAMSFGAMQILPYYKNQGGYAGEFQGGALMRETIIDPVTNMRFDLEIYEEACPDLVVKVRMSLNWYLFTIPEDLYFSTDNLHLTKGFLRPTVN